MPIPATLTSYLPTLLHSVAGQPLPDDSSFSAQPEGQVDYLSHEWREEDVWRSWRSMTRQKNAIANGMRLENASWRTWWKQRNNLPTVSPETLNWLKDSDVTWLYGPLHIGSDWSKAAHKEPPPTPSTRRQNSAESVSSSKLAGKKPILKRRSISQLLSLPQSPFFAHDGSDESDNEDGSHSGDHEDPSRPPLMHTKSDTHISWRSRPFRKNSPPRIIAPESPVDAHIPSTSTTTTATSSDISNSTSSSQDFNTASSSGADGPGGKKKHISFNTFVEQCISIEKPKSKRKGSIHFYTDPVYEDPYDEDSEAGDGEESDDPAGFYVEESSGMVTDSDDEDEDDVLEMRSSRSRSSSTSSRSGAPTMRTTSPPSSSASRRPPLIRQSSTDRERVTIAPIAPTLLKASGGDNHLLSIGEEKLDPQQELALVYVPPSNSIYSLPGTPSLGSEDVYHHRESYFSVGTNPPMVQTRSADSSPTLATTSLPRGNSSSHSNLQQFFGPQQTLYGSPMQTDDIREEDAYGYFGSEDFGGEDYTIRRHPNRARRSASDMRNDDEPGASVLRYAQGGASSVPTGRSSSERGSWSISASPQIVVNEVAGAEEEREEMSTSSSSPPREMATSRDVSPPPKPDTRKEDDIPLAVSYIRQGGAAPVPVPRIATQSTSPPDAGFLSPAEAVSVIGRGRSPGCSPVSGSTTTGSYSYSSDSRSESRGRSSTRNSSFSDRDSSRGTNSPIGSISPTGSALGMGAGYAAGRGRDSKTAARMYRRDDERGRDRTGRKIGDNLSPPHAVGSPSRSVSDDFPPYSPVLDDAALSASTASVSGSSVSGSSTASADTAATVAPPKAEPQEEPQAQPRRAHHAPRASQIPAPSPIPEEEETRSRQPTPANSPVRALSAPAHTPPTAHAPPPKSRPSAPVTSPSEAQATPSSPTTSAPPPPPPTTTTSSKLPEQQNGTLVGRAAEIVSSARGLLGAIWNAV